MRDHKDPRPDKPTDWIGGGPDSLEAIGADVVADLEEDVAISLERRAELIAGRELTVEEIAHPHADFVPWTDIPFPPDNLVFFCPQEPTEERSTEILFQKIAATVRSGRIVHLEPASNPKLRDRCFYVITDKEAPEGRRTL